MYNKKMLSIVAILVLATILVGSFQKYPVNAQGPSNPASSGGSFPVSIVFTKAVLSMTPTSITLYGGTVIKFKPGTSIPAGVKPGVLVTIVAEVDHNGFSLESIAVGTKPAPVTKVSATMQATSEADDHREATLQATEAAETHDDKADDCSGKTQNLTAARVSTAVSANYQDVVNLHCKSGYGYDDIARAYVVAQQSQKPGAKPVTAAQVLDMRSSGKNWDDVKSSAGVKSDDVEKNSTLKDRDDDKKDDSSKNNTNAQQGNGGKTDNSKDSSGKKDDSSKNSGQKDDGNKSGGSSNDSHQNDSKDSGDHKDDGNKSGGSSNDSHQSDSKDSGDHK